MLSSPRKDKGKAPASRLSTVNDGFDDLNPVITYRHLLSSNLGVRNPLRVVALCDSDAFYAACERVRLELDPAVPLVVLQWDLIIAVSYPARKYGISRMDKLDDVKKKCPQCKIVHVATYKEGAKEPGYWENPDSRTHKVSLDLYRRESTKVISMFKEGLPTGEIEKASIDEAFIDFTIPVRDTILARFPHLASVPEGALEGLDTPLPPPPAISWDGLGTLVPINSEESEEDIVPDRPSADTAQVDTPPSRQARNARIDPPSTWHDVALSIAAGLMGKIRRDIHEKLGYTTSAGIARNKFLAKLVASYRKPNGQTILRNAAIPNYLIPLKFQKIRFLGGKLGDALAKEYDVSTVGDLLTISLDEMQNKFGEGSIWVYELLRGIDRSEVKEKPPVNKSMLASKNLQKPVTKPSEGHHWIRVLAAELALRLNEARETHPGLWPKALVLHVRQAWETTRSRQGAFAFTRNVTVDIIAAAGDKLWKELVGTDATHRGTALKITNVSLAFSGIETMESGQKRIETFLSGDSTASTSTSPRRKVPSSSRMRSPDEEGKGDSDDNIAFTCTRCGKKIRLAQDNESDSDDRKQALEVLKQEHDDFHFAQDLSREAGTLSVGPPKKKAKTKKEPEGIAKFFTKKR